MSLPWCSEGLEVKGKVAMKGHRWVARGSAPMVASAELDSPSFQPESVNAFPPAFKMRGTLLSPVPQSSAPTLEPAKTTLPYLISSLPG